MSAGLEAVVLAGGMGTRLRSVIQDIPKPMAPVAGKPFLEYILAWLEGEGYTKTVLSVGYRREVIQEHFGHRFRNMALAYAVEEEPLGTGGGIRLGCTHTEAGDILVVNGDTWFEVDLKDMRDAHNRTWADITCALKPMQNFDRYGTVDLDAQGRVIAFNEKMPRASGLINGGVYYLKRTLWDKVQVGERFSFEKDILESQLHRLHFQGYVSDAYFIDIGIPEDYARAQVELP